MAIHHQSRFSAFHLSLPQKASKCKHFSIFTFFLIFNFQFSSYDHPTTTLPGRYDDVPLNIL